MAVEKNQEVRSLISRRGDIYDRHGFLLDSGAVRVSTANGPSSAPFVMLVVSVPWKRAEVGRVGGAGVLVVVTVTLSLV